MLSIYSPLFFPWEGVPKTEKSKYLDKAKAWSDDEEKAVGAATGSYPFYRFKSFKSFLFLFFWGGALDIILVWFMCI